MKRSACFRAFSAWLPKAAGVDHPSELAAPRLAEVLSQFFVSLGVAGQGSQSNRVYQLNQRNQKTPGGVRVSLELPFDEFLKSDWPRPKPT